VNSSEIESREIEAGSRKFKGRWMPELRIRHDRSGLVERILRGESWRVERDTIRRGSQE
jgi:hypothetical protein